jgi:hypothetical protein
MDHFAPTSRSITSIRCTIVDGQIGDNTKGQ